MLKLKPKQAEAVEAVNDPRVDTLVLFGAVGTGKTDVAAHIVISICQQFPRTRWPVFRQNISTARDTVVPSYLDMLDRMGFEQGEKKDYVYTQNPYRITFPNGSVILFREADATKDRGGKKIKGINASGNHIDEADELEHDMFVQATSRKGRRNEQGQPSLSIVTMNPNDGWAKQLFYDPWKAGTLPPNIRCVEFTIEDSWQSAADIAALRTNPPWWTERYLYNNWAYADESASLFKSRHWDASIVGELDPEAARVAGYDVARSGTDRSVRALIYGKTITDLHIVKDKLEQIDTGDQADWLVADAEETGYGLERLAVDSVGLGVGVVDALAKLGYHVEEYMSGSAPDPDVMLTEGDSIPLTFDNLRSQMVYLYARGVELGIIKHYRSCPYLSQLQKEAMMHHFETTDKVLRVESKDKLKKRLGYSPDLFDAVLMGLYMALRPVPSFEYDDTDEDDDDEPITAGLYNTRF